jgi:hypothetical protein
MIIIVKGVVYWSKHGAKRKELSVAQIFTSVYWAVFEQELRRVYSTAVVVSRETVHVASADFPITGFYNCRFRY